MDQIPKQKNINIVLFNVIVLICGGIILLTYSKRPEIKWIRTMLEGNYKMIKAYPNATIDQRMEMKMGFNYAYLRFVRDNTPETAVIVFPKYDIIVKKPTQFTDAEFSEVWIYNFLYPRRVVQFDEQKGIPESATHIAIMNGWGYDKLNYEVSNQTANTVLPLKK